MKTRQVSVLMNVFSEYAIRHAELTYEKHVQAYCQDGTPFLSNDLEAYASQSLLLCVNEHFSGQQVYELEEINFDLLGFIYVEMFCSRYKELVSFLNGERL